MTCPVTLTLSNAGAGELSSSQREKTYTPGASHHGATPTKIYDAGFLIGWTAFRYRGEPGAAGIQRNHGGRAMIRPTEVEPRDGFRIWLRYQDGTMGEIDLSHLVGRGVFKAWNERACFETVRIAPAGGIAWGDEIELCPDDLWDRSRRPTGG